MQLIQKGATDQVDFFLASSSDHNTGVTGASPTVLINKGVASNTWAAPAGTVLEIGYGNYTLVPASADTVNLGTLRLHATATGADPADTAAQVVAFNPNDVWVGIADAPMTAGYITPGTPATYSIRRILFSMLRRAFSRSITGSTETIFDFDNTTPVHTIALNSSTGPTSALQAT